MKRITLSLFCVSALACSAFAQDKKTEEKKADTTATHAADNTGKNQRDSSGDTKTSGDQSESAEDIKITAAIRRAVVADDSLTMTATNVKIITANGVVTLRGPVNSAAEKAKIAELAKKAAGSAKIENQLEVKEMKK
ncbi:MAG: BON domain-containing protein [Chthoniobacterales bacterium]|nr:BON domain-containing protein [Chthoniobacterales bacterium]MDQ3118989.1 BON domain-containing protein [Verrucomicrobiota bacterium]